MPLTPFQSQVALLLASNRSPDSHLAGGAALHFEPNSLRYSADLDYFHDSVERVATAFRQDAALLNANEYQVDIEIEREGYVRVIVSKAKDATKVEWAHDSAWRFMPAIVNERCGYQLHPIDLAINKVLALAGRDEPRDFLDVVYVNSETLTLGPLCWAAVAKDSGFTPLSLLELIKRRGKYRAEDFARLHLSKPVDLQQLKTDWLQTLAKAEKFVHSRPAGEVGCLYYAAKLKQFVDPSTTKAEVTCHFARPGGLIPRIID